MRRFGVLGVNVLATLAVCAVVASSATAAEYPITALPQLGRCVKAAVPKTGEWLSKKCFALSATHKGEYNWLEGAAKNKFKGEMEGVKLGGPVELQPSTNFAHLIRCQVGVVEEGQGEYKGSKSFSEKLLLIGCTLVATGQKCTTSANPTQESEIEISTSEGSYGFIKGGEKPVAGWDLKGVSSNIVCGKPPETNILFDKLEGSVIAPVKPVNSMTLEFHLLYNAKAGKQIPEKFENEPKDVLTSKFTQGLTMSEEQTGLLGREKIENEEPLELKIKCLINKVPCT
jgi:hypothetical protein